VRPTHHVTADTDPDVPFTTIATCDECSFRVVVVAAHVDENGEHPEVYETLNRGERGFSHPFMLAAKGNMHTPGASCPIR